MTPRQAASRVGTGAQPAKGITAATAASAVPYRLSPSAQTISAWLTTASAVPARRGRVASAVVRRSSRAAALASSRRMRGSL